MTGTQALIVLFAIATVWLSTQHPIISAVAAVSSLVLASAFSETRSSRNRASLAFR